MPFFNILTFQLLIAFVPSMIAATKQCNVVSRSRNGFVLIGHVFKSFTEERLGFCYIACNMDPACQSSNYNLVSKTCEFSSESRKSQPSSFRENEINVYADNPDRGKKGSQATVPGVSCKNIQDSGDLDTSGSYWIRPAGSDVSFQGYCDISGIGQWTRVTQSWIESTFKGGSTVTYSEENNGLAISVHMTSYGCGSWEAPGVLTYIKGYWTKIKYTQEFRGTASCWSIFGNDYTGRNSVNNMPPGLHPFDAAQGDSITNQHYMGGGNSHEFDGITRKCDNLATNFWRFDNANVRYATVVLRRQLTAEKVGIFTGTSCGTPTFKIKDIYIYF
ncbi:uncharacterized protein LOC144665158 [Oculina patagonica]